MNTQSLVKNMMQEIQHNIKVSVRAEDIADQKVRPSLSTNITFAEWAPYWLFVYKKGVVKDNTYNSTYREPVELHLIPYFGLQELRSVTPIDVRLYFKTLTDELSVETQKKIRNSLRQIYEAAIECGLCSINPVTRSLKLVSSIKPIEKQTWSAEEYDIAYRFALQHPFGLEIITLMETAISRSELLGLRWEDHDANRQTLYIENGLVSQKSSKTGEYELVNSGLKNEHRRRCIPLSTLLNGLLSLKTRSIYVHGNQKLKQRPQKVKPEFIFHSPSGGAYDPNNWYRRVLKKFMIDLNKEHPEVRMLTTHELRHTRATLLKDEGTDLFTIARLLGHCDLNMLAKRYAHDNVEALRTALKL